MIGLLSLWIGISSHHFLFDDLVVNTSTLYFISNHSPTLDLGVYRLSSDLLHYDRLTGGGILCQRAPMLALQEPITLASMTIIVILRLFYLTTTMFIDHHGVHVMTDTSTSALNVAIIRLLLPVVASIVAIAAWFELPSGHPSELHPPKVVPFLIFEFQRVQTPLPPLTPHPGVVHSHPVSSV